GRGPGGAAGAPPGPAAPPHPPRTSAAPRGPRRSRRSGDPPTRTVPSARLSSPGSGRRRIPAGTGGWRGTGGPGGMGPPGAVTSEPPETAISRRNGPRAAPGPAPRGMGICCQQPRRAARWPGPATGEAPLMTGDNASSTAITEAAETAGKGAPPAVGGAVTGAGAAAGTGAEDA